VQELQDAQHDLEKHQLLGGIIATIRAGDQVANDEMMRIIRSNVDLSQLAAHVRNECRANLAIQQAFDSIRFVIDGPNELPSPAQILGSAAPFHTGHPRSRTLSGNSFKSTSSETSSSMLTGNSTTSLNSIGEV
jgi:hypothetical protein